MVDGTVVSWLLAGDGAAVDETADETAGGHRDPVSPGGASTLVGQLAANLRHVVTP